MARPKGPLSDAERAGRRAGGFARHGLQRQPDNSADPGDDVDNSDDIAGLVSSSDDPDVAERWRRYLKIFGIPRDWTEALTAQKVHRGFIDTVAAGLDLSERRGKLITQADAKSATKALRDAIAAQLAGAGGRVVGRMANLAPDLRTAIAAAVEAEISAALDRAQEQAAKR